MSTDALTPANQGTGKIRPTALEIIHDQGLLGKLAGKVIVITGATSGIGLETARALSATGATLFLTARDLEKAKTALTGILEPGRVSLVKMDNTSFASIRAAAANILALSNEKVNILINNAGIMGIEELKLTEDGYEMHFATNHLSHFLLFQLLKNALLLSSSPEFHSRVVAISSSAHRVWNLNESDNYNFQNGGYNHGVAYANSKLANIYMANEIDRRYGQQGLHATSLHPGGVNTNISRHLGSEFVAQIMSDEKLVQMLKTPEQGAATSVLAAVGKEWEDKGGKYLEDCEEAKRGEDDNDVFGAGYVRQTYDPVNEKRLWKDSLKMVGIAEEKNDI
ncbi:short-chain dehydrogenase/reductase-like protein [Talaromyces proteolyticus]|uniref:Short-chain dehydrogenase/reductase-like protein n=1 Tax=Talaromyces proteolyticus TaxID=1131652 RepID=A0AAD4KX56_9EURO|nr:short-chain dehydrogenase/reductase-like protein [Talaromyces proteolyticus]KAH8703166.1 short-chain dehydrogenase/reductase-like protein [Talaromyces proteolyticus]